MLLSRVHQCTYSTLPGIESSNTLTEKLSYSHRSRSQTDHNDVNYSRDFHTLLFTCTFTLMHSYHLHKLFTPFVLYMKFCAATLQFIQLICLFVYFIFSKVT